MAQAIGSCILKFYYLIKIVKDISFAVNYLARNQIKPEKVHLKLMSNVLGYINNTKHLGIVYERKQTTKPLYQLYADADFAMNK